MADLRADTYRANLGALRLIHGDVADEIDSAEVPSSVTSTVGRDGTPHFLVTSADGRRRWFGGSSMPSVSAPELFRTFASEGQSVALPGIFTGMEAVELLARMPAHTALFILEPSALNLKLALHLRDVRASIEAGRWIPIIGAPETVAECFTRFFEAHPAYAFPTQLLTPPSCGRFDIAAWQRALEQAGARVMALQARGAAAAALSVRAATGDVRADRPAVAVCGADARPAALALGRRIGRALSKLKWRHELCLPDRPAVCHVVARLHAVARARAGMVLCINRGAESMRPYLPDELPVYTWLTADAAIPPGLAEMMRGRDRLLASTHAQREAALAAGVADGAVEVIAAAADDERFQQGRNRVNEPDAAGVAVIADLPDDRPDAAGISMQSHIRLWQAARQLARRFILDGAYPAAAELLRRASEATNVSFTDAEFRAKFIDLLASRVLPAAAARAVVEALDRARVPYRICGASWHCDDDDTHLPFQAMPPGDEVLADLYHTATAVIFPLSGALDLERALDALAAGAAVYCREADPPWERQYPSLGPLRRWWNPFRSPRDLARALAGMNRPPNDSAECRAEREALLKDCTVSARLASLWVSLASIRPAASVG